MIQSLDAARTTVLLVEGEEKETRSRREEPRCHWGGTCTTTGFDCCFAYMNRLESTQRESTREEREEEREEREERRCTKLYYSRRPARGERGGREEGGGRGGKRDGIRVLWPGTCCMFLRSTSKAYIMY